MQETKALEFARNRHHVLALAVAGILSLLTAAMHFFLLLSSSGSDVTLAVSLLVATVLLQECGWRRNTPAVRLTGEELMTFPGTLTSPMFVRWEEIEEVGYSTKSTLYIHLAGGGRSKVSLGSVNAESRAALVDAIKSRVDR